MKEREKEDEKQDDKESDEGMKESQRCSEEETDEGNDSNSDCDQDSAASFINDTDEEIDTAEIEDDWIENMKSTAAALDQMRTAKIPCWIATLKNEMEISNANSSIISRKMGLESSGMEPWPQHKIQNLQSHGKTKKKKWEDEINEFLRMERVEEETNNDERNKDAWIKTAKDQKSLKKMESSFAMTTAAAHDTEGERMTAYDTCC